MISLLTKGGSGIVREKKAGERRQPSPMELILRVSRTHKRLVDRRIAELGIHGGQHHMLMMLSRLGQMPAQNELARRMDISPASAANMLKRLETGGYIRRWAGSSDGRCASPQRAARWWSSPCASSKAWTRACSRVLQPRRARACGTRFSGCWKI